jgi:hypothetical protein
MDQLAIGRRGTGRPRTRPAAVLGDKAYSSAANRAYLRKRGIKAVIPVKEDQKNHRRNRGQHGGRPPAFDLTSGPRPHGSWAHRTPLLICSPPLPGAGAPDSSAPRRAVISRPPPPSEARSAG